MLRPDRRLLCTEARPMSCTARRLVRAERGARRRAQEVDRDNHTWGNYIMCAYKGVHEHLAHARRPALPLVGLQLLVEGRVPQGAPGFPNPGTHHGRLVWLPRGPSAVLRAASLGKQPSRPLFLVYNGALQCSAGS